VIKNQNEIKVKLFYVVNHMIAKVTNNLLLISLRKGVSLGAQTICESSENTEQSTSVIESPMKYFLSPAEK